MFNKTSFKMIMGRIVPAVFLILWVTVNGYAGGAGAEPEDLILKGGKIVGLLTGDFSSGALVNIRIVGSLYKPSGTVPVALNPIPTYDIGNPSEAVFLQATKEHLENWQLENAGPPNVFSVPGGETLIITRVKDVFVAKSAGGNVVLGAIVTIRARAN
jgi:hypothetical protein